MFHSSYLDIHFIIIPLKKGIMFFTYITRFVCLCVQFSCEQNSSRTDAPIWTRFSLNGCFLHWLGPYWIWWPWLKGQRSQWRNTHFFIHNSLLTSLLYISALFCLIRLKFDMPIGYAICRFTLKFHKIWNSDDVI